MDGSDGMDSANVAAAPTSTSSVSSRSSGTRKWSRHPRVCDPTAAGLGPDDGAIALRKGGGERSSNRSSQALPSRVIGSLGPPVRQAATPAAVRTGASRIIGVAPPRCLRRSRDERQPDNAAIVAGVGPADAPEEHAVGSPHDRDHAVVQHPVVEPAQRQAVEQFVRSSMGLEVDVMIVQVSSRAAPGHHATEVVALEDRIDAVRRVEHRPVRDHQAVEDHESVGARGRFVVRAPSRSHRIRAGRCRGSGRSPAARPVLGDREGDARLHPPDRHEGGLHLRAHGGAGRGEYLDQSSRSPSGVQGQCDLPGGNEPTRPAFG